MERCSGMSVAEPLMISWKFDILMLFRLGDTSNAEVAFLVPRKSITTSECLIAISISFYLYTLIRRK